MFDFAFVCTYRWRVRFCDCDQRLSSSLTFLHVLNNENILAIVAHSNIKSQMRKKTKITCYTAIGLWSIIDYCFTIHLKFYCILFVCGKYDRQYQIDLFLNSILNRIYFISFICFYLLFCVNSIRPFPLIRVICWMNTLKAIRFGSASGKTFNGTRHISNIQWIFSFVWNMNARKNIHFTWYKSTQIFQIHPMDHIESVQICIIPVHIPTRHKFGVNVISKWQSINNKTWLYGRLLLSFCIQCALMPLIQQSIKVHNSTNDFTVRKKRAWS